MSITDW